MKLIDLLNKIANGEEVPKKIKFNKRICILDENNIYRFNDYEQEPLIYELLPSGGNLNDKVEIIEEVKKIEPLLNSMVNENTNLITKYEIVKKVDEIIDYINREY